MATLEERVAYLEGQTADHTSAVSELRLDVRDVRTDMNRRFDQVQTRFDQVQSRFDQLEGRFDSKFMWMVGFQFASFLAAIGALLNGLFR